MTNLKHRIAPFALLLLALAPARAQYVAPPPSRPFAGLINEYLRAPDPYMNAWDIGVNVRFRLEEKLGAGTTAAGSNWDFSKRPVDDTFNRYELTRVLARIGYTSKWFGFLVVGRSSYSLNDDRVNPAAAGKNLPDQDGVADFQQAYVTIGNHKEFPVSAKIGRQEIAYGDQRLLGPALWLNNPRTFDAAKVRYQNGLFGVDVFAASLVYVDNKNLNKSNLQDMVYGAYFNLPKASKTAIVETYLIEHDVKRGIVTDNWSGIAAPFRFPAPQDVFTAGLRIKSKPGVGAPWDYGLEAMYQFGHRTAVFPATTVAAAKVAPELQQSAWAGIAQLGYTWAGVPWSPRLALIGSLATGDNNPTDKTSHTFQNLIPSNHGLYGTMDLSSLQNFRELRLVYSVKPKTNISLAAEAHLQWLDDTNDYWYNVAGVPRNVTTAAVGSGKSYRINPTYSATLGQEVDLLAGWTFLPYATLESGVGHYFRGDYVKQSLSAVGSRDANYIYVQMTLNL